MIELISHTRSLRRRCLAFLVDFILLAVLLTPIAYPFANSLDSTLRVNSNFFHYSICKAGEAFTRKGDPISKDNWDGVLVCNVTTNGVFPGRSATFVKQTDKDGVKFTQFINFQIDSANRLASPIIVDTLILLILPILAAAFECSKFQATPGKLLLGLKVTTTEEYRPNILQGLTRNILKLPYAVAVSVTSIATSIYLPSYIEKYFLTADNHMNLPSNIFGTSDYVMLAIPIAIGIVNLVILASLFLPWKRAGRALYDRWSGTKVITTSQS